MEGIVIEENLLHSLDILKAEKNGFLLKVMLLFIILGLYGLFLHDLFLPLLFAPTHNLSIKLVDLAFSCK